MLVTQCKDTQCADSSFNTQQYSFFDADGEQPNLCQSCAVC